MNLKYSIFDPKRKWGQNIRHFKVQSTYTQARPFSERGYITLTKTKKKLKMVIREKLFIG